MTTLENRPNTALIVIDVQNGVVGGRTSATRSSRTSAASSRRRARSRSPSSGSSTPSDGLREGERRVADRPELSPDEAEPLVEKNYADSFEDTTLETVLVGPRRRAARRRRRTDRRVHPLDAPRRLRQGLRRDPRQRRAHDGGPVGVGRAAAGQGDRAHEPLLDEPRGAGAEGRDGRDEGRRLQLSDPFRRGSEGRHDHGAMRRREFAPLVYASSAFSGGAGRIAPSRRGDRCCRRTPMAVRPRAMIELDGHRQGADRRGRRRAPERPQPQPARGGLRGRHRRDRRRGARRAPSRACPTSS